jgi:hypothetical protein
MKKDPKGGVTSSGTVKGWLLIVMLLLSTRLTSIPAHAAIYYVAKNGNDTNPGTVAKPWKTIKMAAKTLMAGDKVYIKAGTYRERVVPLNSGRSGKYITYAAYPGNKVTIDGKKLSVPEYAGLFDMTLQSYIKVSDLRVMNSTYGGILADGSSHIIIEKNYTYNTASSGISAWGCDNVIIKKNEVVRACTGKMEECISVGGTHSFEISNNYVHDAGNPDKEGICAKDGSSNGKVHRNEVHHTLLGIYVDAWNKHTFNIEVYRNNLHDNGSNGIALASEQGGLLENIKVYNNISYHNVFNGIAVTAYGISTHPMKSITIMNNTFYHNGEEWGQGIYVENPQAKRIVLRNNICSQNLTFQIALDSKVPVKNCTIDHNLIDGPNLTYGKDYVKGNPRFVDPTNGNFHLRADSSAIDAGSSDGAPSDDYDGNSRPSGIGYDIGAFEYQPS